MYTPLMNRWHRYYTNILLFPKENNINYLNQFLKNHNLDQFLDICKQYFNCEKQYDFCVITTYNIFKYNKEHYKQMLQILKSKYLYKIHLLLPFIKNDFLLYKQFVQIILKQMLIDEVCFSDCLSQISSNNDSWYTKYNYDVFIQFVKTMLNYCYDEQLKDKVQTNIIDRLIKIKNGQQKQLKISCQNLD